MTAFVPVFGTQTLAPSEVMMNGQLKLYGDPESVAAMVPSVFSTVTLPAQFWATQIFPPAGTMPEGQLKVASVRVWVTDPDAISTT
ncbi:unannotated protein [freshwater metagenome]|uniref:Unannotated protein n=1 Tax=freshwater metagenome TaxID=449393 RepID=A0A6J7IKK5_9ZZZZ